MDAADALRCLESLEDDEQLAVLESIVRTVGDPRVATRLMPALFGVLERFPWSESHGGFWSILHAIERVDGYEAQLVESVRRSPGEYNLRMVNRLLESGARRVAGVNLHDLLREVSRDAPTNEARTAAQGYLSHQHGEADW